MRVTIIHPCIGRRPGQKYIRTWQMEPLPAATLAGLTPADVDVKFYDDRMEAIPFDEPTDLVAVSVETYTAKRAYQIATEYRRRRVPVVMGGFHASLVPDEVARYAEAVVVGEAEGVWAAGHRRRPARPTSQKRYKHTRPAVPGRTCKPDRTRSFAASVTLPVGLVEAGRGCHFKCEFCAVQTVFDATQTRRPVGPHCEPRSNRASSTRRTCSFLSTTTSRRTCRQAKELSYGRSRRRTSAGSARPASTPRTTRSSWTLLVRQRLPRAC